MNEIMEPLLHTTLALPVIEVSVLVAALSICLVFRLSKIGLVIAYLFAYRWGWLFFIGQPQRFMVAYLVSAILVGTLTVIGMLKTRQSD